MTMEQIMRMAALCGPLVLGDCAAGAQGSDARTALAVAAAIVSAHEIQNPEQMKTNADLTRLLSAGQAALVAWQASSSPDDQRALDAAIAALIAYEAAAGLAQSSARH